MRATKKELAEAENAAAWLEELAAKIRANGIREHEADEDAEFARDWDRGSGEYPTGAVTYTFKATVLAGV